MSVVKNPSKVYVGNIPRDADEGQIEKMFDEVGKSLSLEFKGDFAFVEYADSTIAEEAIRKFDGVRIRGRRLIVEPFRYRGGDPRYRRPPPKNVIRGEFRCIVTNLSSNTTAQDLRDWVEHEKLLTVTVTDVYNRHGLNEGVVEFKKKDDWDFMIRNLDRVKLDSHYVRVYDEREYNRRKLKVYDRPQGSGFGGRDRDRNRDKGRSRSYSRGRSDRNNSNTQRSRNMDRGNGYSRDQRGGRDGYNRDQRGGRQRFRSNSAHGHSTRNGRDNNRGNGGGGYGQDSHRRNMSRSRSRSRDNRRDRDRDRGSGNGYNQRDNRRDRYDNGQRQRYDNTQRGDRYDRNDRNDRYDRNDRNDRNDRYGRNDRR